MITQDHYLILTAIGRDSSGTLAHLSKVFAKHQCDIIETKLQRVGQDLILLIALKGSWHAIAKLEAHLPTLEKRTHLSFQSKRTENPSILPEGLPYQAHIIGEDKPGILAALLQFFSKHHIDIDQFSAETFTPPKTRTSMCSLTMLVRIPIGSHLANVRDAFLTFCEEKNLDAMLDPLKIQT